MKIRRISIYDEFQCTKADCPANCCRGWRVPIDHDAYVKYLKEKGIFGAKLRLSIKKTEEVVAFRSINCRCPFWNTDHLCAIQKKHGTDYMPSVCVQFPRKLYNLKFFCEETLYLACPEAAKLFLETVNNKKAFSFMVTEEEVCYETAVTNDDKEFLNYLLKSRNELIRMLRSGTRYDSMAILSYGQDAQNACLCGKALPNPLVYSSKERYPFDSKSVNQWMFCEFYHPKLKRMSPLIYRLCKKYIRRVGMISGVDHKAADKKLNDIKQALYHKIPDLDMLLNRYYEYYLFTDFFNIFDDYSFLRHLRYGMAKTHMMWLFLALYAEKKENISMEEIAEVIALYERRAPHIRNAI